MLDKKIIKNISSLFSLQMATYIIPLITLPYLVRVLGVEGYGYLTLAFAIINYFLLLVNYGFDLSATNKVAKCSGNIEGISLIFWNVACLRICIMILSGFFLFVFTSVVELNDGLPIVLASAFLNVIGTSLFPQWLFQGLERLGLISGLRVFFQALTIPLIFIWVEDESDIWLAACINSLPIILVGFYSLALVYRRKWVVWIQPSIFSMWLEIKEGWPLFISTVATSLHTNSVPVLLSYISGPAAVGYYMASDKIVRSLISLVRPVTNSFFPRVSAEVKNDKSKAKLVVINLINFMFYISIVMSVALFSMADIVINLIYGKDFSDAIILVCVMSFLPLAINISSVLGLHVLIPFGFKELYSRIYLRCSLFSFLIINLFTYFYAALGAAYAVVLTEFLILFCMIWFVNKNNLIKFSDLKLGYFR
jgi:PST family polysaccharide transporter